MASSQSTPGGEQPYDFYREHYSNFLIMLTLLIILMIAMSSVVLYQITHRPVPPYTAVAADGKKMSLMAHDEPNLLPATILRWASKAAVAAYTFDFANSDKELAAVRPYFTEAGWESYQSSIADLIASIKQNQLFVSGVVVGAPVISNEGDLTGSGYTWRVQLPFLVTTQSAETTSSKNFTVTLTIVKVPTQINPTGIGLDQFVMF